jgi:hypothetical protein
MYECELRKTKNLRWIGLFSGLKKRHLFNDAAGNKSPELSGLNYLILFTKNFASWL